MKTLWTFMAGFAIGIATMFVAPFVMGEIDFGRVARGDEPLFVRLEAIASDGGTALYHGFGYRLTAAHSLAPPSPSSDEEMCFIGPDIAYYVPFL